MSVKRAIIVKPHILKKVASVDHSNPEMSRHFQGIIETVWSGADSFLEAYYNPTTYKQEVSDAVTVKKLIEKYKALENR